ncbi:hypothetical protein ACFWOY_11355 [Streptomyces sp. NPDC058423]|uniref:hypothetical protein n=1 Tax=unclassified Streptomyces TaxID=2593676 RepID=UPI0036645D24
MHPRIRPLTLAVLLAATGLAATGCVSVPATPPQPQAPGPVPAGTSSPSPVLADRRTEQAPAHGELASTGPQTSPRPRPADTREAGADRRDEARGPAAAGVPAAREGRADAPERRARGGRGESAPKEQARAPRKRGKHTGVRPIRPRTDYGMRDLCRASDGMADPSLVAMCRASYGR